MSSTDVFIVDKISMMSSTLLELIDSTLRKMGNEHKLFSGKSIVLLGDLFQLSPVIPRKSAATMFPIYESVL